MLDVLDFVAPLPLRVIDGVFLVPAAKSGLFIGVYGLSIPDRKVEDRSGDIAPVGRPNFENLLITRIGKA